METLKFKTNIKCGGCLAQVSPNLNETVGKGNWEVDTQSPDKILTVDSGNTDENSILTAVRNAGYKAERMNA